MRIGQDIGQSPYKFLKQQRALMRFLQEADVI